MMDEQHRILQEIANTVAETCKSCTYDFKNDEPRTILVPLGWCERIVIDIHIGGKTNVENG